MTRTVIPTVITLVIQSVMMNVVREIEVIQDLVVTEVKKVIEVILVRVVTEEVKEIKVEEYQLEQ